MDAPEKAGIFKSEDDKVYVSDHSDSNILHSPPHVDLEKNTKDIEEAQESPQDAGNLGVRLN